MSVDENVGPANMTESRAVKVEKIYGRSTDQGLWDYQGPVLRPFEMIGPKIGARIEQEDGMSGRNVEDLSFVGFSSITVKTGQSKIFDIVAAARTYMIYSKSDTLPTFICVAVFTKIFGTQSNSPSYFCLNFTRQAEFPLFAPEQGFG